MCYYTDTSYIPAKCPVKHKIQKRRVDSSDCEKFKQTGLVCVGDDLKPARGLNGEIIQLATYHKDTPCERCLS